MKLIINTLEEQPISYGEAKGATAMGYVTDIIIAALAFAGTFTGCLMASNKAQAVMEEQLKNVREDINILSARVDKHNSLVERMAVAESKIEALERRDNV